MIPSPAVIRSAIALMRVLPVPVARALGVLTGNAAWIAMADRRRILLDNLSRTAADRSPAERRRLVRRTFVNMAGAAVDQFRLPSISPQALRALFEIRGLEHLDATQAKGRGTIVVTAHLGPYELASACVAAAGYKVHGMVENLSPAVMEALATYRSATGMQLVNMKDGIRAAYRILGAGEILALVADRAIGEARSAIELPFAGGIRRLPIGPAVFSQATGAPIITGFVTRHPNGHPRYLIEMHPPLYPQGRDTEERDRLTRCIVDRMSAAVTGHPDEWFVFQPDWVTREPT